MANRAPRNVNLHYSSLLLLPALYYLAYNAYVAKLLPDRKNYATSCPTDRIMAVHIQGMRQDNTSRSQSDILTPGSPLASAKAPTVALSNIKADKSKALKNKQRRGKCLAC
jgi:hypothetical protein